MSMNQMFTAKDHATYHDHIVRVQIQGRIRVTWVCETVGCEATHLYPMTKASDERDEREVS